MQLNLGIFEYNNHCGYILKPDFMRRDDRRFDPFAESIMDGVVAATLTIKVVLPTLAVIRMAVMDENNKLLGHRVLPVMGLRPGYRHIPLRNECNLPLLMPTVFVHISVKDYVPDDMSVYIEALINPIAYLSEQEKHSQQLAVLEDAEFSVQSNGRASVPPSPQHEDSKPLAGNKSSVPAFTEEVTKQQITKKPTHPLVKAEPSNGQPNPSLLVPTPLKDLKNQKGFFKVICKRDKELESLSKKHEKARETMREIHELQEERLMISQVKAKTAMEKVHAKSLKKAIKTGNVEQVEQANRQEYQQLTREQDEKVPPNVALHE
uniref:1-phosphatidylinositol-4,5-bisphosphate phosphodiesterase beta-4 n=1 Tax=Magallana gigas TaxID=29159 RepID=K1PTG0_MAGGI